MRPTPRVVRPPGSHAQHRLGRRCNAELPLLMVNVLPAAVVPGLGPGDGRGVVGAAVVPALRGVGAARTRPLRSASARAEAVAWKSWPPGPGQAGHATRRWWPRRCSARAAPGTRTRSPTPASATNLGVDAEVGTGRSNETQVGRADEGAVYGDAAYGTHARSTRLRALGIADRLMPAHIIPGWAAATPGNRCGGRWSTCLGR